MGKVDAQMQARMDGMAYALKIAKERGIDELEGKPIRNLIMCPCDVPLTQKFITGRKKLRLKLNPLRKVKEE